MMAYKIAHHNVVARDTNIFCAHYMAITLQSKRDILKENSLHFLG